MIRKTFAAMVIAVLAAGGASAHDAPGGSAAKVTLVYEHPLPNVPGKSLKGVLVE